MIKKYLGSVVTADKLSIHTTDLTLYLNKIIFAWYMHICESMFIYFRSLQYIQRNEAYKCTPDGLN